MTPLSAFFVAAALSLVFTIAVHAATRRLGLVSLPNGIVPQHTGPVSTLGGTGIAAGAATAVLVGAAHPPRAILVGGLLFLTVGALDDLHELGVGGKLALQGASAGAAVVLGVTVPLFGHSPVDRAAGAFWIIVLVNAVNVTDVCDGLVAGLAAIAFLALAVIVPVVDRVALVASGSCLGFLLLNAPPARIFLGNAGSELLGFLLAAVSLESLGGSGSWQVFGAVAVLMCVFLFEVAFIVVARSRRHLSWWRASNDHFSLRLQGLGLSRYGTLAVAWGSAVSLALAAWSLRHLDGVPSLAVVAVVLAALVGAGWRLETAASHRATGVDDVNGVPDRQPAFDRSLPRRLARAPRLRRPM